MSSQRADQRRTKRNLHSDTPSKLPRRTVFIRDKSFPQLEAKDEWEDIPAKETESGIIGLASSINERV